MEDTLEYMLQIVNKPGEWLSDWKQKSRRKVIGCAPMHVPEEIVHAAGAQPSVLWEGNEAITIGHSRIQSFFCGIARSLVDLTLKRKLDYLDGVVFPQICIPFREIFGVVKRHSQFGYYFSMYLPKDRSRGNSRWFLDHELCRFRASLAEFTGSEVTDDKLGQSIQVYNQHRALLRELYEFRRRKPGAIKASEMLSIVASGMIMPKDEHTGLLRALLPQLGARRPNADNRPRIVLSGSLCEWPNMDLLDLIEESGSLVVDDDLYAGRRYFATDVDTGIPPLEGLASRYLRMAIPCPTTLDPTNQWGDYLVDLVRRNQAQGVIILIVKYCEPHTLFYPDLANRLSAARIPYLMLETEHETPSWGQFKTRIQAFLEALRRK